MLDFLAVAQHGSLHAAARAAGQTQPALSKSLRRLECDLGAPLFVRHAKGVQATEFGQRFLVHAQRLAAEAQQARGTLAQMVGERRGRVEYGISAAASILLAPAAIRRFRQSYPMSSCVAAAGCTTRWRRCCAMAGSTSSSARCPTTCSIRSSPVAR